MSIVLSVNSLAIPEDNSNPTFVGMSSDGKSREKVASISSEVIASDKVTLSVRDLSSIESGLTQTEQSLGSRIVCSTITSNGSEIEGRRRSRESLGSSVLSDGNLSTDSSSRLPLGSEVEIIDPIDNCRRTIVIGSKKYNNSGSLYRYVPFPGPAHGLQYSEPQSYGSLDKEQKYLEQLKNFEERKEQGEILSYDAICRLEQVLLECQKEEYEAVKFKYVEGLDKITRFSKWNGIFTRVRMLKASFVPPKVEPLTPTSITTTPTTHRRSIAIGCSVLAMVVITGVGLLIRQYS